MKSLIIGYGEIGKALEFMLESEYDVEVYDISTPKELPKDANYEIMHICFPYSALFVDQVKAYQYKFNPKFTVIHSTVPVGTSRQCDAIHSPVMGIHPNLVPGMETFIKFIGGEDASEVADYFRRADFKVYLTDNQESTELMKIQSTTLYSLLIEFYKDMKVQCDKNNVPYELWTLWNQNYNDGYEKLGRPEFKKPLLIPIMKKQGGHCTLPNLELIDTKFTKFLKEVTNGMD